MNGGIVQNLKVIIEYDVNINKSFYGAVASCYTTSFGVGDFGHIDNVKVINNAVSSGISIVGRYAGEIFVNNCYYSCENK